MVKKTIVFGGAMLVLGMAASVLAQTAVPTTTGAPSSSASAKIACVGAAVAAREVVIDAGVGVHSSAINAAYAARATALGQAYAQTTVKGVGAAVKSSWAAFNTSIRSARRAWQATRDGAWKQFRASAAACKAPIGVGDHANVSSEASGN